MRVWRVLPLGAPPLSPPREGLQQGGQTWGLRMCVVLPPDAEGAREGDGIMGLR